MKYFKIILFTLLLSGVTSITFSQEKNAVVYVGPSTWQESAPISTNDPVPPLGEGEEKLISEKMDEKTIKQLIDSFVDRTEASYTGKYTAPEGFIEWLKANPQLRSTFWLALNPYYDNIGKAMEVLNELRNSDTKAVERFYHLAVAFALVWDSPDAIQSSRYACIWKMSSDQFEPLPKLLDNFKYFTDPKHLTVFNISPDKLTWTLLVHIVDLDLAPMEIEWGLKNYQNKHQFIRTLYDSIKYDYNKASGATPNLGNSKYNLQNLFEFGGICGDQAHFASRLAKLFGTPSMKVAGTGRSGEGHAWLGFMNMKNNRLELDFNGRYFIDFYYTGAIFDPQTRTKILDSDLAMLYEGINLNYDKYINSITLSRMAQGLIPDKPEVSINLTINALQQNMFCAPAWLTLMKHIEKGTLKPVQGITWFNQMTNLLNKYPDAIMSCLVKFMECIPKNDYQKRDANYQTVAQIFKSAKRPDLLIRLNLLQGEELCARGQENRAMNVYLDCAQTNAGEGNLILPLLDKVNEISRKLNKVQEAVSLYEKIIQKIPHFRGNQISKSYQEAARLLVYLYYDVAMTDKANKLSKMAQLVDVVQVAGGIDDTNKKKQEKSITELNDAIKKNLKSALAYNERGEAYRLKGETDKALADYNDAIKLNPKFDEAYNNRANLYSDMGDFEKAIADYNEAIKLNPKKAAPYNNRGFTYYSNGELDKAMVDYNEAIKLNPKYGLAYYNRSAIYYNKGEFDKAFNDLTETINLDQKYDKAYLNRGTFYIMKGEIDKAITDFSEAIRLNPRNYVAYNNRGLIYHDKGEFDKAMNDCNEAIRLNPTCDSAYTTRSSAYITKREFDKAIDDCNEAIRLNPTYDMPYNNRGTAYNKKGELDKAMNDFNEAIRLNPRNYLAYSNRGAIYANKGELDKGLDDYEQFLKLAPSNHPFAPQALKSIELLKQELQEQNK